MAKNKGTKAYIGEDGLLHPVLCASPECEKPLADRGYKYCSSKCAQRTSTLKNMKSYKSIHKHDLGVCGARNTKVESSIKKDETFVMGNGRYTIDDIPIDNDIWEAVELRDEQHRLDCIEHENRRVIAGFEEFIKSYNEHHDVAYATMKARQLKEQNG
jgi:hypothetical protein